MENNPYQAPESDLRIEEKFKRSLWWKIYFFFITLFSGLGFVPILASPEAGISEYLLLLLWVIATVGLFGFVFLKPVYKPAFWLQILEVYILFTVTYYFTTQVDMRMGMSESAYYISNAIGWLISVPGYYALYSYSKPTNPAWKNA